MKKLTTSLLLFCLPFSILLAQFHIGISGAFNGRIIQNQNNYGYSELEYTPSFGGAFGFYAGYQFGKRHSIMLEANKITAGQAYEETVDGTVLSKDTKLQYWQIPLTFNIGISRSIKGNITYLILGGYYASLSSADITWKLGDKSVSMVEFQTFNNRNPNISKIYEILGTSKDPSDYKTLFENKDFGVVGGVGFKWQISKMVHFITELRGNLGLSDINTKKWQIISNYDASKNAYGGIKMGLGVSFGGGEKEIQIGN